MQETTLVIFRKWRDSGDILALFPQEPTDINGYYCLSYERVGQHSGADYHACVRASTPASPEESVPLTDELTRIGYRLRPIKRASPQVHETRRATARAIRTATAAV